MGILLYPEINFSKNTVGVIFGELASDFMEYRNQCFHEENPYKYKLFEDQLNTLINEDEFHIRAFKTEEEAKAYIQGIDDATGWLDSCVLDEYEIKILNNILKEKSKKTSLTNAKFVI